MPRAIVAVLLIVFVTAGCDGSDSPTSKQSVVVRVQSPSNEPVFTEGYVTDLRLATTAGSTAATKQVKTTVPVLLGTVTPGRYRLQAAVRPCDANCDHLDPTAFDCTGTIVVPAREDAKVIVAVQRGLCDVAQQSQA